MNKTIYGMIDDLYLLCIVIDKTSIAAASCYLDIPSSTISRRIASLEEKLNAKLFTKKGRNITATTFGLELFQHYQSLFNHLNDDLLSMKARHSEVAGKLKLIIPMLFYQHAIKPALLTFIHQYPNVELDLVLAENQTQPELDTDIIITFKQNINANMIARPLFESSLGIYISTSVFDAGKAPQDLQELRNSKWIGPDNIKIQLIHKNRRVETLDGLQKMTVNCVEATIEMVEAGIGIASLPVDVVKNNPKLVRIFTEYEQPREKAYLIYKERKYQTKATQLLIDILIKEVAKFVEK